MQTVHICKGTFSVLWPRVLLFSNSPVVPSGTSWPNKCNSHKQKQPNLLTQAFCHGKSAFAASTLSDRGGTEREVTHHGNSSFCHGEGAFCIPLSLGSADWAPSCGAWALFPWEHLPGEHMPVSCCLLPEFRLPPPPKKPPSFTAFWGGYNNSFF